MHLYRPASRSIAFIILLTLLLAGCQNAPTAQAPTAAESAQPTGTVQARLSPVTTTAPTAQLAPAATPLPQIDARQLSGVQVRFWHPWSGDTARQMDQLVEAFNRENVWGIKVTTSAPGGSGVLFQAVTNSFKQGPVPSLVAAPADQLLYWQANNQALANLNDYLDSPDWGLSASEVQDFLPLFWQQDQFDGQRLGVPAERTARVLLYNESWAQALGFQKAPATTEEFRQQACAAMKANTLDDVKANDGTGGWIIDRDSMTLMSWIEAFRASGSSRETGQEYRFNTPETAQAFAYIRKLFDQGCAWISRLPLPYDYFSSRQALFYSGSMGDIAQQERTDAASNNQDRWRVIPFPSAQGEPLLLASGPSYAILKTKPEEQLAAWLFVRWVILTRNQVQMLEASGTLPLSTSARAGLSDYASLHPHWAGVVDLVSPLRAAPNLPDWWLASSILEDAGWQVLQPTPQAIPAILKQVDDTIPEILQRQTQEP